MSQTLRDSLLANIPKELQNSSRWLLWRLEDTPPKDGKPGRERCKVPKKATEPSRNAASDKPESWSSLQLALANFDKLKPIEKYQAEANPMGIGLAFGSPYFGVDLDKCLNPETGEIDSWAEAILEQLPKTYTEVTPSLKGFHLWYRCAEHAKLPDGHRTEKAEVYSRGRYFTMTGKAFYPDVTELAELSLPEAKKVFDIIHSLKQPAKQSIQTALSNKLQDLMTRTDFPDLSAAVQSLLTVLAIETVCDAQQMELRFKQSKLYLETHWREKWERLGKDELEKACKYGRENLLKQPARNRKKEYEARVERRKASQFSKKHQHYFWEPWLPIGQLVHFGGGQGQGKTPVILDLAARLTAGREWPDGCAGPGPKSVLLLNMEDDIRATTIPRFELAGGNLEKLEIIEAVKMKDLADPEAQELERGIALDKDMKEIARNAREIPDLGLIIIDPITNYLGQAKMNAEEEVRAILTPIALLAQELGITVATVGHFNRRERGTEPLARVMGAAAFTGVARGVVLFGPDNESESTHSHVMTLGRGATESGGMKYHTEVEEVSWDGDKSKVVKVCWDGKAEIHADDTVDTISRQEKSKTKEAAALLVEFLGPGKRPANECLSFLERNGFDLKTINTSRVRKLAKVGSRQEGVRNHVWFLATRAEESERMF